MPYYNQVTLVGNVVRDPSIKTGPSGGLVASLTLGLTRRWTTESGEKKEEACFVDVDAFGKPAGIIEKYVRKGEPILIDGRLKLDQWEDKTTKQKRSKLGVIANGIQLLSRPQQQGEAAVVPPKPPEVTQKPAEPQDDVPF